MGTKVYGIAAAQNPDNSGETIIVDNIDTSRLRYINDEHGEDAWSMIGSIDYHAKIHSLEECKDDRQRRCWQVAQAPFLYVTGEIADDSGHPNAEAAAALIKFTASRPDIPLKIGFSIEGGILKRGGTDNKVLEQTIGTGASFTVKPCNPRAALFLENDLRKSELILTPPPIYYEALKKSASTSSFRERPVVLAQIAIELLEKSLDDYMGGFTSMKCHHCGDGVRFFKSSKSVPNGCSKCGESFRLSDIWKALNK